MSAASALSCWVTNSAPARHWRRTRGSAQDAPLATWGDKCKYSALRANSAPPDRDDRAEARRHEPEAGTRREPQTVLPSRAATPPAAMTEIPCSGISCAHVSPHGWARIKRARLLWPQRGGRHPRRDCSARAVSWGAPGRLRQSACRPTGAPQR